LGASGTVELSDQIFLIKAADNTQKALIVTWNVAGDRSAPELTIDKIRIQAGGAGDFIDYKLIAKGSTYVFHQIIIGGVEGTETLNALPRLGSGDIVRVSGTWRDDSSEVWTDTGRFPSAASTMGAFNLEWVSTGTTRATPVPDRNGAWETGDMPGSSLAGAYATVTADLADLGGNKAAKEVSFMVNTSEPELARISSDEDGRYKPGDHIAIYLEFNVPVYVTGGAPSLTLNNGVTAAYDAAATGASASSPKARHYFSYTVGADPAQEKAALDVTAITIQQDTEWKTANGTTVAVAAALPAGVNSLGRSKTIVIDNTAPAIQGFSTLSSAGTYNADKTVYIVLTFTEAVDVTVGDSANKDSNATGAASEKNPYLRLNNGARAFYEGNMGAAGILFKYTVRGGTNEDTSPLAVTSLTIPAGNTICDMANAGSARTGNAFTVPGSSGGALDKTLAIDTTAPGAPTLTAADGSALSSLAYDANNAATIQGATTYFTVTNAEAGGVVEYSTDNGANWRTYSSAVSLAATEDFFVSARQRDAAGNQGAAAAVVHIKMVLSSDPLFTNITADATPGTYNARGYNYDQKTRYTSSAPG
jgi:hypothetical protein